MLQTETNTPAVQNRIVKAACRHFHKQGHHGVFAVFEHGQWWIELRDGSQWSVVDADGPGTTDGFGFEQVSGPTDD